MPVPKSFEWKNLSVLTLLSGVTYNSWIIGYWLNTYVARHDLASSLEGRHQPFNWLFISCDIISSFLLLAACSLLYWKLRTRHKPLLLNVALLNAIAFALGTIFDALVPLNCDPSMQKCQAYIHDPVLLFHGLFSILSSVCLFIAMAIFWWIDKKSRLMWIIVAGYMLFGIFSIVSIIRPGQDSWAQHYSLLFDGVCIAAIPFLCSEVILKSKPAVMLDAR